MQHKLPWMLNLKLWDQYQKVPKSLSTSKSLKILESVSDSISQSESISGIVSQSQSLSHSLSQSESILNSLSLAKNKSTEKCLILNSIKK